MKDIIPGDSQNVHRQAPNHSTHPLFSLERPQSLGNNSGKVRSIQENYFESIQTPPRMGQIFVPRTSDFQIFAGLIFPNQFALLDDLIPVAVHGCNGDMELSGDFCLPNPEGNA